MRKLFEIDTRGKPSNGKEISVQSVRAIILSYGRIAMVKNVSDDIYKFPGGEIRAGEDELKALSGRIREETGMIVIPGSETEFGYALCRDRVKSGEQLVQRIFYYICSVEPFRVPIAPFQNRREGENQLDFVSPVTVMEVNRLSFGISEPRSALERDLKVLRLLTDSGIV